MTNDIQQSVSLVAKLVAERERQGLTLESVAEKLKLPVARIEQLEALDKLDNLSPFDRGHLRNYANLLGVSYQEIELSTDLAQELSSEIQSLGRSGFDFVTPRIGKWLLVLVLLSIVAIGGYYLVSVLLEFSNQSLDVLPQIETQFIDIAPNSSQETDATKQ